jgi:heat shock protein HslJ
MPTTLMACPDPVMQRADAYIIALMQAVSYKIDGQLLTLRDAKDKTLATFSKLGDE